MNDDFDDNYFMSHPDGYDDFVAMTGEEAPDMLTECTLNSYGELVDHTDYTGGGDCYDYDFTLYISGCGTIHGNGHRNREDTLRQMEKDFPDFVYNLCNEIQDAKRT